MCNGNLCLNGGICIELDDLYYCECVDGYDGAYCELDGNMCETNPCQNGGFCEDGNNSYMCNCPPGFVGNNCETDENDCDPSPCRNDGTCNDGVNTYTCQCSEGFTGRDCEIDVDHCDPNPCQNGGDCNNGITTYTCQCSEGFAGQECQIGMCPPEWLYFQSSCYWFSPSDVLMKWAEAIEHCNTMNAYLAVPNTPAENMYLYEQCYPRRVYLNAHGLAMWLLGCTDIENEGTWVCLDHTILSYDAWNYGEPSNSQGDEDCLSMDIRDGAPPAVWNDITSTIWAAQFICEKAQAF
ncbi:uncharacterized protein LOC102805110 [Saccoglossus kowalevskii]